MTPRRVLVLGGAGFIGLHLCRRLVADGHQVSVVDDFSRGRHDPELDALGLDAVHADLTDPQAWRAVQPADHVYLLAAVVGVRNVEQDPARVIRVNTRVVMNLLDWMPAGSKLFFASTSETYAGGVSLGLVPVPTGEGVPLVIEDVASPRFTYAISKMLGEAAVIHTARAKGFEYVIGRFHNVYGPRMGTDHVIPELLLRAMSGVDPFVVYGTEQSRAFCYVEDAVEAMVRLMELDGGPAQLVHVGNDREEIVIADLAHRVLKLVGSDTALDVRPAPPGSVPRRCPDLTRLRQLTRFEPVVSLDEGLRRTYEWYRHHSGLPPTPVLAPTPGLAHTDGKES